MFCHKCGNKSLEDAAFCQKCGEKLVVEDTPQQTADLHIRLEWRNAHRQRWRGLMSRIFAADRKKRSRARIRHVV